MTTYAVIEITTNPIFNYFFSLVIVCGGPIVTIALVCKVLTRS